MRRGCTVAIQEAQEEERGSLGGCGLVQDLLHALEAISSGTTLARCDAGVSPARSPVHSSSR